MGNNQSFEEDKNNDKVEQIKKVLRKKEVTFPKNNTILKKEQLTDLSVSNINNKISEFENTINIEQDMFDENEKKIRQNFTKEQQRKKQFFENEINKFEKNYDPYQIFNLNENTNIDEIKKKYKKLALKYHPDRCEKNTEKHFQLITQSYLYLINKYKQKENLDSKINKEVINKEYSEEQQTDNLHNVHLDVDKFDIDKFNTIFDKYKMPSAYDDGYGEDDFENSNTPNNNGEIFSTSFNIDVFNKSFNNLKENNKKEIIKYNTPDGLSTYNNQFELGCQNKLTDFGDINNNNLSYTDYKRAYTVDSTLINPDNINIKKYNSINEIKAERENIKHTPNDFELRDYNRMKEIENENEANRIKRLNENDNDLSIHYNKINSLLLK